MMKQLFLIFFILGLLPGYSQNFQISSAKLQAPRLAQVQFTGEIPPGWEKSVQIEPPLPIDSASAAGDLLEIRTATPFRLDTHYYLLLPNGQKRFLQPDGILDSLYSDKPLGCTEENGKQVFRVFAPRAKWLRLVVYDDYRENPIGEYPMSRDEDGVWEYFADGDWSGKYYGYRVWGPQGNGEIFDSTLALADPYSRAVATQNHYTHPGKTLILREDKFDWQGDSRESAGVRRWLNVPHRDLVIYEMHVRDLTAHPSSGAPESLRGSYPGLIYENQTGGISYLQKLGVNAVELLPAQDFGNVEIPYRDSTTWIYNTWNPYAFNHWGYMTSYFFAPESYYASGGNMIPGEYNGGAGRQVREFKEMVRAFHRNGIAVMMDVVYNHVSQYDNNCFKYLDKFYYFHLTAEGEFAGASGCGNDFQTARPMARRMIVESVKYWMQEYHIDGFRFDLGYMIDPQTRAEILQEARKLNPHVFITAEPWGGGGYDPNGFSDQGWSSWNDQFRNGFKGWQPGDERRGFIFGEWQGSNSRRSLQRYVMGSPREFGGQYLDVAHSVNYVEAHDNHTLGDFIRIGLEDVTEEEIITDLDKNARLTPAQLKLNKLAALALLTSQGPVMLHEGQEFARSKVIAPRDLPDIHPGRIDHNSYEKDDETNWLNFRHAEMNRELLEYYRDLIALRKQYPAFRRAEPEHFRFLDTADSLLLAYELNYPGEAFLVALNGNRRVDHKITLPEGRWEVVADGKRVYLAQPRKLNAARIAIPASSGLVLKLNN